MSDLHKLILAKTRYSARFWVATIVLYFIEMRGIPAGTIFQMMSVYYFFTVILEYPTGIIGDYYSHRLSVFFGYAFLATAFILMSLPGSIPFYIVVLAILALGETLVSGSDTALLHTLSKDFRKDLATIQSFGLTMSFVSISLGGFVAAFDLRYPLWLTSFALIIAAILMFWCHAPKSASIPGNIFTTASVGLKHVFRIKPLLLLMILSCTISGFFLAFKYFYNPIFQAINIPLELWGILAGSTILVILIGVEWYKRFPQINLFVPTIMLILSVSAIGFIFFPPAVLLGIFFAFILRGYMETRLTVEMNTYLIEGIRASILSLNSLLVRGAAMVIVFISGLVLNASSLTTLFITTAIVMTIIFAIIIIKLLSSQETYKPVNS